MLAFRRKHSQSFVAELLSTGHTNFHSSSSARKLPTATHAGFCRVVVKPGLPVVSCQEHFRERGTGQRRHQKREAQPLRRRNDEPPRDCVRRNVARNSRVQQVQGPQWREALEPGSSLESFRQIAIGVVVASQGHRNRQQQ